MISVEAPPPALCFKRGIPPKNFKDSTNSLLSIEITPANRPDLADYIPDQGDREALLHYLDRALPEIKKRDAVKKLIAECDLTDDEIKILHSYKIQTPYPVYLWLNGWLMGDRRDDFVKENVAPFFVLLYRAMEKLPKITTKASRAIKVNGIPALKHTFDNYKTACTPKSTLSFWGFSSFSTEDDVVNREEFVGKPHEAAIVYSCSELIGVDMEPFAPQGLKSESEILPLCPCVLEVLTTFKMGEKLIVAVKQVEHAHFAYVPPKTTTKHHQQVSPPPYPGQALAGGNSNNNNTSFSAGGIFNWIGDSQQQQPQQQRHNNNFNNFVGQPISGGGFNNNNNNNAGSWNSWGNNNNGNAAPSTNGNGANVQPQQQHPLIAAAAGIFNWSQ